jgi:hypothetical protein
MSNTRPERRRSQRVVADATSRGQLKARIPVIILNLSVHGLLFELKAPLRPGMTYDLEAHFPGASLTAPVRIARCRAGGYAADGRGGRCLLFHAGAEFTGLAPDEKATLLGVIERGMPPPSGSPAVLQRG